VVAVQLLSLPWLKLAGSVLLLWIALQLLVPQDGHGDHKGAGGSMLAAVRAILIADFVMSIDNVIAVAAAAKGSLLLLIVGLAISIPLVVFASTVLLKLMSRWPIIITIGAALLGWVAGEMAVSDVISAPWVSARAPWLHWVVPAACAALVVVFGKWLAARKQASGDATPLDDLAAIDNNPGKQP
jgi:YjbE family integral membrane protein